MAGQQETAVQLVDLALSAGASLAGIVNVSDVKQAAVERSYSIKEDWLSEGWSVMVLALAHPPATPELDWYGSESGTSGNHLLKIISEKLRVVFAKEFNIQARILSYQPGPMGLFLKDAAVLAGLGCMGANNLLLTSQYGPRIRLRGLLLDTEFPHSGAIQFSPCASCSHPCWKACPQNAFAGGSYNRLDCRAQMRKDELNRQAVDTVQWGWVTFIKYCRACELACPVGSVDK